MKTQSKEDLKEIIKMNVPILDLQHYFLIELLEKFDNQLKIGEDFFKLFLEGSNYLNTHAKGEEDFMIKINYPHMEEHKIEHDKILEAQRYLLKEGTKNGGKIIWDDKCQKLLSEWRNKHFNIENLSASGDGCLIKYVRKMKNLN